MIGVPLQAIDNILLPFHMGHILLGAFVLAILGSLPLKSKRIVGLNIIAFGAIFLLLPTDMAGESIVYRLLGAVLVVVGPMIYVAANR